MKKYLFKLTTFAAILVVAVACDNAKYSSIDNRLYISEAAPSSGTTQQVERLTINGNTTTTIHVRLAQPVDYDVTVSIGLAPEFVDEYNALYGTAYEVLSEEYFTYDKEATVTAGNVSSSDIAISVTSFESEVTCCIPLKITSTDSNVQITESTSRLMFVLETPLMQYVPIIDYKTLPSSGKDENWGIVIDEWTIECWVLTDYFSENKSIFTFADPAGGSNIIYIRFEDPVNVWNTLQLKTFGSVHFNGLTEFELNKWYHIAFVGSCPEGNITLYVNGEVDGDTEMTFTEYPLDILNLCDSGSSYFKEHLRMAQVRLWSKALSQSVIQKQMNSSVSSNADGLIGYWKMDEGSGSVFYDSSSYGHHLYCSSAPSWSSEQVNFSNPND